MNILRIIPVVLRDELEQCSMFAVALVLAAFTFSLSLAEFFFASF